MYGLSIIPLTLFLTKDKVGKKCSCKLSAIGYFSITDNFYFHVEPRFILESQGRRFRGPEPCFLPDLSMAKH